MINIYISNQHLSNNYEQISNYTLFLSLCNFYFKINVYGFKTFELIWELNFCSISIYFSFEEKQKFKYTYTIDKN